MKIVFMGTPAFAIPVLSGMLNASHEITAVYTQPDRPAGRNRTIAIPPVKQFAQERKLPVSQPISLRSQQVQEKLESLSPDIIVVAAYGLFLPPRILNLPPLGCLNIHPSILPQYRGPSPVSSAILNGDDATGTTIIEIDEGMDSGPIVALRETPIGPRETSEELTTRLFQLGASLLVEILPRWSQGQIQTKQQDNTRATITKRLSKDDGEIDWQLEATYIARQLLAYHPWPGSFTHWHGKLLKILEATAEPEVPFSSPPGLVLAQQSGNPWITTGKGILTIQRLQLEGKQATTAHEFSLGHRTFVGSIVE